MIFYFNGDGSFCGQTQSQVFQGSHKANSVYFMGPFSSDCQVMAKFRLENGEETKPQYFTLKEDFTETLFNSTEEGICVWEGVLTHAVTKLAGTVRVQFTVLSLVDELTTEMVSFNVKKGVLGEDVQITDEDGFDGILRLINNFEENFVSLENKLDKVSTNSEKEQAYIKGTNGEQDMISISEGGNGELVKRKQNGNITAGTPVAGTDATPKSYIEDNYFDKNQVNSLISTETNNILKENYRLIEKIIVGYSVLTSKPADWNQNYTSYYTNTGTQIEPVYVSVSGSVAPTWESGKYYSYSSQGVSSISRKKETNGSNYNFKRLLVEFVVKRSNVDAYLYNYISYGDFNLASFNNLNVIQTSKQQVYFVNEVIDKKEICKFLFTKGVQYPLESNTTYLNYYNKKANNIQADKKITGIYLLVSNSAVIPAESIINIYGE